MVQLQHTLVEVEEELILHPQLHNLLEVQEVEEKVHPQHLL
tara:strand:+ start:396 stop:518 length:123 start_codon:yes stop_codon:yes gene_type:complete